MFILDIFAELNNDLPDELLSGFDSGASNGSSMPNGSVDQMGPGVNQNTPGGGVPVSQMGGMMPMRPVGSMGQMGTNGPMGGPNGPGGQNMNLVNSLNKPNGSMMGGPVSSGDMMTSMNSSMPMSSMPQASMGHQGQMTMAPMGTMSSTMVSSGGGMMQSPGMMQQTVRPMMGQQTIINAGPGNMNGPMVRHISQLPGAVMRQGGPGGMMPGTRMITGPVRIQNMVCLFILFT